MSRTAEDIRAELTETRQAYRALILGKRPQSMKHGDRELRFDSSFEASKEALLAEIARLEAELARAEGRRSPRRPMGV